MPRSLDLIISGYPWKRGEVVFAVQEYGAMQLMFEQIADRHGVIINKISIPNHPTSDEEIINPHYENNSENKTDFSQSHDQYTNIAHS